MIVAGQVPLSELNDYQSRLNSMTGGHGSYTIQFSHYDNVPPGQQEKMASRHKAQQDTD